MKTLTLTVKEMPSVGLEAELIKPESFTGKTTKEIKAFIVYAGKRKVALGEVFDVKGDVAEKAEEQHIVIEKSTSKLKHIGEGMRAGEITIKGDVGYHLGEYMRGGRITVEGNAGSWVGTNMEGGEIVITGNAGSYVGCSSRGVHDGMKAGRITVKGNAGTEVGVGLSGGEINVEGRVEDFCGSYMREGIIRAGGTWKRPGYAMNGGEIVIEDPTFNIPFYFKKISEEDGYSVFEGDTSFGGKGKLKIRK